MTEAVESITMLEREEPKMVLSRHVTNAQIDKFEADCLKHLPEMRQYAAELPLEHHFAPGVYLRQLTMPTGTFLVGHTHRTEHLNIVVCGRANVLMNGEVHQIVGPCVFKSLPGIRKVFYVLEHMVFQTVHPTHETDLEKLDEQLINKTEAFKLHDQELKRLKGEQ